MKKIIILFKNVANTVMQSWISYTAMSIALLTLTCFNAVSGYFHIQKLKELNNKYENYYMISKEYQLAGYLIGTNPEGSYKGHTVIFYFNPDEKEYSISGDNECTKCYPDGKQSPFGQNDTYYTEGGIHDVKIYKNCNILADEGTFNAIHDSTKCTYCSYRTKGIFHSAHIFHINYDIRKKEGN